MADTLNKNEEGDGFWTGLLVGGLLGTVAGLFIGGDDKNALKKKLKTKALDVWDDLSNFSESVKDKAIITKDDVIEEVEEVRQGVQEVVNKQAAGVTKKFFSQKGRSLHKQAKL